MCFYKYYEEFIEILRVGKECRNLRMRNHSACAFDTELEIANILFSIYRMFFINLSAGSLGAGCNIPIIYLLFLSENIRENMHSA